MKIPFYDGLKSLVSALINERNASAANEIVSHRIAYHELRAIFRTGLGNKIIRIKNGYALKEPFLFENPQNKDFYNKRISRAVKKAGSFMLGFGRGVIVINEIGADLSKPASGKLGTFKLDVFSGDMVTAGVVSMDLKAPRYFQPEFYHIRGHQFHYSRIVDFKYIEPAELDLPLYQYGGVSEFELIYNQLVNDGVIERASATMIDRNSTLFYKVKGFKSALQAKQESDILNFFSLTEKARNSMGAGLIDSEDDAFTVDQTLTNLDKVDQISLRRLAMVTSIPLAILVGENVKGLNSTGDTEKQVFNEAMEILQQDYYLDPINELFLKLGMPPISFSDSQNITPIEKIKYEGLALDNAKKMWEIGEDFGPYLEGRGVIEKDNFAEMFEKDEDPEGEIDINASF